MKVKDSLRFEILNDINVTVFELSGTILTPQPQIDLMLEENQYCLGTNLHCLIKKNHT